MSHLVKSGSAPFWPACRFNQWHEFGAGPCLKMYYFCNFIGAEITSPLSYIKNFLVYILYIYIHSPHMPISLRFNTVLQQTHSRTYRQTHVHPHTLELSKCFALSGWRPTQVHPYSPSSLQTHWPPARNVFPL